MDGYQKVVLVRMYRSDLLLSMAERMNAELSEGRASALRVHVADIVTGLMQQSPELEETHSVAAILGRQTIVDNFIARFLPDQIFAELQARYEQEFGGDGSGN